MIHLLTKNWFLNAMIYTETKGLEADVMQSSESATGYTNTSQIAKSIRQGVIYLTENLATGRRKKGVEVWTAVQAYNFGPAYIDYIANMAENIRLGKRISQNCRCSV